MVALIGLVSLFGLLSLVVAVVGLIAPTVFKSKKTGKVPTRWTLFMGGLGFMFLASALVDYLNPKSEDLEPVAAVEATTSAISAENNTARSMNSMGLTVNEFHNAFNDAIGQYKEEFKTADFDVQGGGATDTFSHVFNQNLSMMGTIDKSDGNVDMVIINVSMGQENLLQPLAVLLAATEAVNPDVSLEENKKIVMEIFNESVAKIDSEKSVERKVGDLHYSATTTRYTGMMFGITKSSEG
ncbi:MULTISPECIES: hypothetical protein [Pseudomonas]|uniref:hypothetical protein n=1 Tax=Pseudomonas TaxID=286 RepID=UPI001C872A7A|nr:hypothetical protein [Pseudomonas sp. 3-2]QZD73425.1 hypothetical protein K3819_11375 [Pseudomonas sp. 3-2]